MDSDTPTTPATITVALSLPPGVNGLYPTLGGRRTKSKDYKAWLIEAGHQANQQGLPAGLGYDEAGKKRPKDNNQWAITFRVCMRDRRRDLDGVLKAAIDFLASRLHLDDRYLDRLEVQRVCGEVEYLQATVMVLPDGVRVEIEDANNARQQKPARKRGRLPAPD